MEVSKYLGRFFKIHFSTLYNSLFLSFSLFFSIHPKKKTLSFSKEGGIIIKVYLEYIVVVVASRFFGWLVGWLLIVSCFM